MWKVRILVYVRRSVVFLDNQPQLFLWIVEEGCQVHLVPVKNPKPISLANYSTKILLLSKGDIYFALRLIIL
jgi:hypothetical protein